MAVSNCHPWSPTERGPNSHFMERILVIDDDSGFRDLLETILRKEGYDVESGASIADAVDWAPNINFTWCCQT